MSWDTTIENFGYWVEVASHRMARRALHTEAKSLSKMEEDEAIQEWIAFFPEKRLTKSLRQDVAVILAKKLADRETKADKKDKSKTYPENF